MEQIYIKQLSNIVGEENVRINELMKKHTTFRIGGPADCFLCPHNASEIAAAIALCKEADIPYFVLGNGSNLLVSDEGYRGVVIKIFNNMKKYSINGNILTAQAGILLSKAAGAAYDGGLTGLEFAAGIPGTLGGAIVMNAGAYDGEMKEVIYDVTVLKPDGSIAVISKSEMDFGYRSSIISGKGYIVLEASMLLKQGNKDDIQSRMQELKARRNEKQPLEYPSAGSTFKRPEGYFAGKLIMDAGLRGLKVGGAQVSEKHCGFVINRDEATASDVKELMQRVSDTVYEKYGVRLETEVKILGEG